jgi:hypothetical protein
MRQRRKLQKITKGGADMTARGEDRRTLRFRADFS